MRLGWALLYAAASWTLHLALARGEVASLPLATIDTVIIMQSCSTPAKAALPFAHMSLQLVPELLPPDALPPTPSPAPLSPAPRSPAPGPSSSDADAAPAGSPTDGQPELQVAVAEGLEAAKDAVATVLGREARAMLLVSLLPLPWLRFGWRLHAWVGIMLAGCRGARWHRFLLPAELCACLPGQSGAAATRPHSRLAGAYQQPRSPCPAACLAAAGQLGGHNCGSQAWAAGLGAHAVHRVGRMNGGRQSKDMRRAHSQSLLNAGHVRSFEWQQVPLTCT